MTFLEHTAGPRHSRKSYQVTDKSSPAERVVDNGRADGSRARTRPGGKWSTRPTEESELVLHWATGLTGMIFCLSLPDDWCCLSKLSGATGVCLLLRSARKDRCRLLPRASLRQMPPAICHKLAAWVLILRRKKCFSEDLEVSGGQFEVVLQKRKPRTDN